jgi:NADPH:quinone reductase-like Zn-dependent oxidoreductase
MYALISRSGDAVPRLEQVDPPALGPGDVRVAVAAAGFTFYDSVAAANHALLSLPDVIGLGFDFSGTVLEVGSDVSLPVVGDRVAGLHGDVTALTRAHASEVVVPATALAVVPDRLSLESAAAATLSALTARQALDLFGTDWGRLLVTGGAGAVGNWAIVLAKRDGWSVDALVRPGTEDLAREAGAVQVLTDLPQRAYDAVLDTAALQQTALAAVRDGGRFVGVKPGQPVPPERNIDVTAVIAHPDGAALTGLLELAATREAPVRIAASRPLTDAASAYAEANAASGSEGRWLLVP